MLEIKDLAVKVEDKEILKNFNLTINDGEIHVLMGRNGIGKSTICKVLMKDENYQINNGHILYNNNDITSLNTFQVANLGFYLINQSPLAIEGVTTAEMLRASLLAKGIKANIFEFSKELESICEKLQLPKEYVHKDINVGMSGGERKKIELIHMWMLKPKFIILDELDSGLDVDALNLVSQSLKEYYEKYNPSILIITHHPQILNDLTPNYVHILNDGKIVKTGDINLALSIEKEGYTNINKANLVSGQAQNE